MENASLSEFFEGLDLNSTLTSLADIHAGSYQDDDKPHTEDKTVVRYDSSDSIISLAEKHYLKAEKFERDGFLNDAILEYQKAFKACPDIERIVVRRQSERNTLPETDAQQKTSENNEVEAEEEAPTERPIIEQKGKIFMLPTELIQLVLSKLVHDPVSIVFFSRTCKLMNSVGTSDNLWRLIYLFTHKPILTLPDDLTESFYHQNFLNTPRIRFDGVYISQNHYLRQGVLEGTTYNNFHMVTYYRYLKFLRDGRVYALLSNETPDKVVPLMKTVANIRRNDIKVMPGDWVLDDGKVNIVVNSNDRRDMVFHMELVVKCRRAKGSWNKLSWTRFYGIQTSRGDEKTDFPKDQLKSYIFARVKSFL